MDVFLSSTSRDLVDYRKRVDHAIRSLTLGTTRMEAFGALPGAPLAECRRLAAEADALVVIVAHRHGWIPSKEEDGDGTKSVTWHEVEAAQQSEEEIPIFAFLVDEMLPWTGERESHRLETSDPSEHEAVIRAVRSLRDFKDYLRREHVVETFTTPDDLAAKVVASLANWHRGTKDPTTSREAATPPTYRLIEHVHERDRPLPSRPYPLLLPHRHPTLFFGRERDRGGARAARRADTHPGPTRSFRRG